MGTEEAAAADAAQPKPQRRIKFLSETDRKNSSSDLQSRLKTRKLLGVGEASDSGGIHRSKISQILGLNEHLFVRLPVGLGVFELVQWTYLVGVGSAWVIAPAQGALWEAAGGGPPRLLGAALLGYAGLLSASLRTGEGGRSELAGVLAASAAFFGGLASLGVWDSLVGGGPRAGPLCHAGLRAALALGNLFFHHRLNPARSWLRVPLSFLPLFALTTSPIHQPYAEGNAKDKES